MIERDEDPSNPTSHGNFKTPQQPPDSIIETCRIKKNQPVAIPLCDLPTVAPPQASTLSVTILHRELPP